MGFSKLDGMTHQTSFAHAEFAAKKKTTRREKFLAGMEEVLPWARLLAVIEPHYPKGQRGRPPLGLERMLVSKAAMRQGILYDMLGRGGIDDPRERLRAFARLE